MASEWKDKEVKRVINKSDLNKMAFRSLFLQASFNYERMQAAGWLFSLIPGLKKIHTDKDDLSASMQAHMEFFNTHPFLVTLIMGIVIAMEESKESIDSIRGIKVGMMGPLGGIGDALFWLTILPITASIGVSMALQGSVAGPIIFLVLFNGVHFGLRWGLMHYSYKVGINAVDQLHGNMKYVNRAATIVGLTVVGALIASYIGLNVVYKYEFLPKPPATESLVIEVQSILDAILPKLLPLLYTFFMYFRLKKGDSTLKLIGITMLISLILVGIPLALHTYNIIPETWTWVQPILG